MPDTSYTGIQVPVGTDGYSFEQQLGDLADSARVIIPAANATAMAQVATDATAAGFAASAAAPLFVHRTDQDVIYRNTGSGWTAMTGKAGRVPFNVSAGTVAAGGNGTASATATIDYSSAGFTQPPVVLASAAIDVYRAAPANGRTATSCAITVTRLDGGTFTGGVPVFWVALQMTPTSAGA